MMTLILEIRNLKNKMEKFKSGSVTTAAPDVQLEIDTERKKKKSIHIPIVLDIKQHANVSTEKVKQTKMAENSQHSRHGKGNTERR